MPTTDGDDARETDSTGESTGWHPAVDDEIVVHPGSDEQTPGRIIDDFGEFTAAAVEVNETTIAPAARRWAVLTSDGDLVFVDTDQMGPATRSGPVPDGD